MGFPPPAPDINDELIYTTAEPPTVAVQPGALRVNGNRSVSRQRIQFATGGGPAGGAFTGRWLKGGVSMGTITVADGTLAGDIAGVNVADGNLLRVEVLALGGATGAAVFILDA